VRARLRYAQTRSLNNIVVYGVQCSGTRYWLFANGDANNKLAFPGESATDAVLPASVGTMTTFILTFDQRGAPFTDVAATPGNELAATLSITVGGRAGAVRVTPVTGYIPD
jgi:hypothetical protein